METQSARIKLLTQMFPNLLPTLSRLGEAKIDYMIGGSGCLFLLGNDRAPKDMDIFLRNADHDRADKVFSVESLEYLSASERVRNSNPFNDHAIQFTSHLRISIGGTQYDLSITDEVVNKRPKVDYGATSIWLLPPEEVILIKAFLKRGSEVGKSDLQDIKKFESIYHLDKSYIRDRAHKLNAEAIITGIIL